MRRRALLSSLAGHARCRCPQLRWLALAVAGLIGFAPAGGADTYQEWKTRVFSEAEQADPAVSGATALSPAGDGLTNLLKYAFGVDPHVDGSLALPHLSSVQAIDPATGQTAIFATITHRASASNLPVDLYFVPELSSDLQIWRRGDAVFAAPSSNPSGAGDDLVFTTSQALLPLGPGSPLFLRVRVLEGQTLPNDWQMDHFGQTGIVPAADPDGDGKSNFDEFLHGTDPGDYYEGRTPVLEVVSGDGQRGASSSFLPAPLVVQVRLAGVAMVNAPIRFTVANGDASVARINRASLASPTFDTKTDANGMASAFLLLGAMPDRMATVQVRGGSAGCSFTARSFATVSPFVAAGGFDSFTGDNNGTLWIWGANWTGQLGDGTTLQRDQPVQSRTIAGVAMLAVGYEHCVALKRDGTVWAWGANYSGQLGDGTFDDKYAPVQVAGLADVTAVPLPTRARWR